MARWRHEDYEKLEKVGKVRKRQRKTPKSADLQENFEKPEDEWELGGESEAFAARVVEVHKRYVFVSTEKKRGKIKTNDVWLAEVARKFRVADRAERNFVSVGDRVLCTPATGLAVEIESDLPRCVIQNLAPRTSRLARLDPHNSELYHVMAANMDQVMIVASYLHPTIKWGLIDRYLVLAEREGIPAIIVLTKKDLLEAEGDTPFTAQCVEMEEIYRKLGYQVFSVQSNLDDAMEKDPQFERLGELLDGRITLATGHSGVGKSSIVNLYDPEIIQPVEPDSNIFYKGRHTTTYASFIKLGTGGYVIDTPGIRSLTFDEQGPIELSHYFVEFRSHLGQCKFRECRHIDEPDCSVLLAVEKGEISKARYKSYLGILLGASGREGRLRDMEIQE